MIKLGFYLHYKGGIYLAFATGKHSETGEVGVLYVSARYKSYWFRPESMWNDLVHVDGGTTQRFTKLGLFEGAFAYLKARFQG
jgi:hypothetical protein